MINKSFLLSLLFLSLNASAQEGPEMADAFRADGKIYVVIGVISIIFIAIVAFLIMMERKIKKLEDKLKK